MTYAEDHPYNPVTSPYPPPLRGIDEGTFTQYSVAVRLGEIARRVPKENDLSLAAEQLMRC